MLLRYCIGQENGGIIADCVSWKDRKWQQLARVTQSEIKRDSDLWEWHGDDLHVWGYPNDKQDEVQRLRGLGRTTSAAKSAAAKANGAKGGRPTTNPTENPTENPTINPAANQPETHVEPIERKGKEEEGNSKGMEGEAKSAAATQPEASLIEKIRQTYPRRTHQRETSEEIAKAISRHSGDAEDVLNGTIAIANAVAGWTENERLQFLKVPTAFFAGDHWQDDPAFWASKKTARAEFSAKPSRIIPDLGGRAPSAILSLEKL